MKIEGDTPVSSLGHQAYFIVPERTLQHLKAPYVSIEEGRGWFVSPTRQFRGMCSEFTGFFPASSSRITVTARSAQQLPTPAYSVVQPEPRSTLNESNAQSCRTFCGSGAPGLHIHCTLLQVERSHRVDLSRDVGELGEVCRSLGTEIVKASLRLSLLGQFERGDHRVTCENLSQTWHSVVMLRRKRRKNI